MKNVKNFFKKGSMLIFGISKSPSPFSLPDRWQAGSPPPKRWRIFNLEGEGRRGVNLITLALLLSIFIPAFLHAAVDEGEVMFKKGEALYEDRDYAGAIKVLKEFTDIHKTHVLVPHGYYLLAWSYFNDGRYADARSTFQQIIDDFPDAEYVEESRLQVAESYSKLEDYGNAVSAYRGILSVQPDTIYGDAIWTGLGWSYYRQAEKEKDPSQQKKFYEESIKALKELLEKFPKSPLVTDARYFLASVYTRVGRSEEARALFADVIKSGDIAKANDAYFMIAKTFEDLGEYVSAIEYYRKVKPKDEALVQIKERIAKIDDRVKAIAQTGEDWKKLSEERSREARLYNKIASEADIAEASLYQMGLSYFKLGRFIESRILYKEILRRYPKGERLKESTHGVVLTYTSQGNLDLARTEYNAFITKFGKDPLADNVRFLLGNILYEKRDFDSAIQEYKQGLQEYPAGKFTEQTLLQIANCRFFKGEYNDAVSGYEKFVSGYPQSTFMPLVRVRLADCQFATGNYRDALEKYRKVKAEYPQNEYIEYVVYYIGLSQYQLGEYQDSIKEFQDLLSQYPKGDFAAQAKYKIGDCYYAQSSFDAAVESYQAVINGHPGDDLAIYAEFQTGMCYYYKEDWTKMASAFDGFVKKHPQSPLVADAFYRLGENYQREKEFTRAREEYGKILSAYPKHETAPKAQLGLAVCYQEENDNLKALAEYEKVLKDYGESDAVGEALVRMGKVYLGADKYQEGVSRFTALINEYTGDLKRLSAIYTALAELTYGKGEVAAAMNIFQEMLKKYPEVKLSARGWTILAEIFSKEGNFKDAVTFYQRRLNEYPDVVEDIDKALFGLGTALLKQKEWGQAGVAFERITRQYAWSQFAGPAVLGYGRSKQGEKKYTEALDQYKKVIEGFRDNLELVAEAIFLSGEALFEQGEWEKAVAFYERVTILYAGYPEWAAQAYLKAGECYQKLNNPDEAQKSYQALVSEFPDSPYAQDAKKRLVK